MLSPGRLGQSPHPADGPGFKREWPVGGVGREGREVGDSPGVRQPREGLALVSGCQGHGAAAAQLPPQRTMALSLRVARREAFILKLFPYRQLHGVSRCTALRHQPPHHETERQKSQKPLVTTQVTGPLGRAALP